MGFFSARDWIPCLTASGRQGTSTSFGRRHLNADDTVGIPICQPGFFFQNRQSESILKAL